MYKPNPDITRALTIPADWYTDPAMLAREHQRVFRRSWQFASGLDELTAPGSFVACDVVGIPVVLTRDSEGVLHAFYNVCRHRAGVVAEGCGRRQTLQCAYHGWTYNLDGSLRRAPEFAEAEEFDPCDFGLIPVRVETFGPFAFVNMSGDAPPLMEMLGNIPGEVADYGLDRMKRVAQKDYVVNANWKLYVDNYLEGYHIPTAHKELNKEIDYSQYRVETFRYYSAQHAPIRPVTEVNATERRYTLDEGGGQARYYWLFPNLMLNIYQGMVQVNVVIPMGYDRTVTRFEWYFPEDGPEDARKAMHDSMPFSDLIQDEDIKLCEDVWRNLQTGVYTQGRYSPKRENGVYHFHGLLAECLGF